MASSNEQELARMRQLRKAVKAALDKTFNSCRPELLATFFSEEARSQHGRAIEESSARVIKAIRKNIEDEIDKICTERELAQHLNRLDMMCAEQLIKLNDANVSSV